MDQQSTSSTVVVAAPYNEWISLLGRSLGVASRGCCTVFPEARDEIQHISCWPDGQENCDDLVRLCRRVRQEKKGVVLSFAKGDDNPAPAHIGTPLVIGQAILVYSYEIQTQNRQQLNQLMFQLEYSLRLLRQQAEGSTFANHFESEQCGSLIQLVQQIERCPDFAAAAQQFVDTLCETFDSLRVSLGMCGKETVEVTAISHQTSRDKSSILLRDIRLAMEECLDQKEEVSYPAANNGPAPANLLHQNLSRVHGAARVLSLPFGGGRENNSFILLVESPTEKNNTGEENEFYRAAATTVGPVLHLKNLQNRSLAAAVSESLKTSGDRLRGKKSATLLKILPVSALLLFLCFVPGDFRVPADVQLTGTILRSIVAPFPGYIATSENSAGDHVEAGETLATLDTSDLTLDELSWASKYTQADLEYRKAIAENSTSQAKIIAQQKQQAEIQLSLLKLQKERAVIKAPFTGMIVSGDLSQSVGGPVERGRLLFEMVPDKSYRIIAQVDEKDISYLAPGQQGSLVFNSLPKERFHFTVTRITPVATAAEGRNSFRVEAGLDDDSSRLRPGMKGYAKIRVGSRPYLWLWTRSIRERLRLLAWNLLP